ncbi:hypothetical protein [Fodinicola acaciae]|uniref:hypothetical protein n=1 Tax=Fodinicola acaciae TaxID=2681555 RepID=UPI0013D83748|nr:hypothetical protein [Fodinicola acaciae]
MSAIITRGDAGVSEQALQCVVDDFGLPADRGHARLGLLIELHTSAEVLSVDVGRKERLAGPESRKASIARDKGYGKAHGEKRRGP